MKRILTPLLLMSALIASCASAPEPMQSVYPEETFKVGAGKYVQIAMINHGSIALRYRGFVIQVDPVANNAGKTVDYAQFPLPDVVLVTHEHGDHFNVQTLESINSGSTRYIMNQTCYNTFLKGEVISNGESTKLDSHIAMDAVPAYNTTPGRERLHPKGNGNGYVLDFDGFRVYVSGDTENVEEMADLKDIDVAFLSTNQPYTMTVEQCISAARVIQPKVLIPYHLSQTDMQAIADGLAGTDIEVRLYEELR